MTGPTSTDYSLAELSTAFAELGQRVRSTADSLAALQSLAELGAERVPGADHAGVILGTSRDSLKTVGATDPLVHQLDAIQYELNTGPCVDAAAQETTFNVPDLRTDPRWPRFGRRASEEGGILSMLSMRLYIESDKEVIAGLNLYSTKPDAFDRTSETVGLLIATHGALAASFAASRSKAENLMIALNSSREIGIAMGVLMAQQKLTRDQAFDVLRIVSQHTHRKVADLAGEVADTGALPEIPHARQ